jgi:hypothetical protein
MVQAAIHRPVTSEARSLSRVSPCEVCGGQSGTGTGFSPRSSPPPPNTVILPMFHTHYWFYDWSYVVLENDNFVSITKSRKRHTFLTIKPTRCTNLSNLFLEWNSTCFGQFLCPSSGVFHCTHSNGICHTGLLTACEQEQMLLLTSCQQTCMTYTIAVCTVKNSWWWTEELSETCRISFQE